MKKTILLMASVLLIAAFALSACGPKAAPSPEAPAATEAPSGDTPAEPQPTENPLSGSITIWHAWKTNEIWSLNEVLSAFNAAYPNVSVDVLYVPFDDLRSKFETAAATGEGPDILIGAADWGPALYDASLISDISGDASSDFLATINPAALGATQYKGALIGLPETVKGVVMFRNTSIVPEAPTSFDDLVTKATAATSGDVKGAYLEYGFFFSAAHLDGVGGKMMNADGTPAFNDAKGVEWVNLINRFKDAGTITNYTDDDVNLFKAGKAGIIIDGTWNTSALAAAVGADNLAIDPWPSPLSGYVQTENIYMSANVSAENKDAAWAFMQYFLGSDAQTLLADPSKAAHIPAINGVEVTDPLMQQSVAAFAGGAVFPVIPEMGAYWDPMNNMLKKVVEEGADPATALQEAFDAVTAKVTEIKGP
jgi:arabinogalactan oligomer/maltooligosaccharide transport system substrate-binding protein